MSTQKVAVLATASITGPNELTSPPSATAENLCTPAEAEAQFLLDVPKESLRDSNPAASVRTEQSRDEVNSWH